MGAINAEVQFFRDIITEELACKSGLLLTDHEAGTLLRRDSGGDADVFEGDDDGFLRIRAEDLEDLIVRLRAQVGELPDAKHGLHDRIGWLKELLQQGIDPAPIYEAFGFVVRSGKYKNIDETAAAEMVEISGMSALLVYQFLLHTATQMDRSMSWMHAEAVNIDWAVPLRNVFESENVPDDPDDYLDQRYIDYFVKNSEDLAKMQWRNFERLTAEFFHRKGYEVVLGPGTNDGGVDVRVWPANSNKTGPPLLLVQCKRHSKKNDVAIETVKSFWSDVAWENAKHGLIATTSRIAPGGIATSRARRWPLGFAENKQVAHWVKTMWRHAPKLN